jgi:hypothetical protein
LTEKVRIEAGVHAGMQRLVKYISRCPLNLARMVMPTDNGDASKSPTGYKPTNFCRANVVNVFLKNKNLLKAK